MSSKQLNVPFDRACDFVIKIGKAAHGYGSSAPRLESFLSSLMRSFGYIGGVISTPQTMIFVLQENDDKPQRMHILSSLDTGFDLDKLALIGDLIEDVINERATIDDALKRFKEISKTPAPWGAVATALSYAISGAGIAGLLVGSWSDILVSMALSILVYFFVSYYSRRGSKAAYWLPLISAFAVGAFAALSKVVLPELNIILVTLASLITLIPGYTITMGTMELAGGQVISGTANLINGMVYLLKQVAGAWIGVMMITSLTDYTTPDVPAPNMMWQWLFVPALAIGLCISFQTSRRDLVAAIGACLIAYLGSFYGSSLFGSNAGTVLGTIVMVVFSNKWTTKTNRPTSIVMVPGMLMLVSGAMGFRGMVSIAAGQVQEGEHQLNHMFFVAIAIAIGLVIGNTISRPKVTL
jgi:uncharacterized membrane protein YjjP (DUF1212 family)